MENRAHAIAAGLFVLVFGAAVVAALWWFGEPEEERTRYVLVTQGNITGLNLEAQVRYRGIDAGKVEAIAVDASNPGDILVYISMRSDLRVTRGTRAALGYQGVTGLAYVQLEDSGEDPRPLESSPNEPARIALQPGLLDQASDAALNTLNRISELADRLTEILSEQNVTRVERSLEKIESAARKIDRTFEQAPRTLAAVEDAFSPDKLGLVPQVLHNFEVASRDAGPAIRDFRELMQRLDSSARNFDQFANSAGQGVMTGILPNLNALLQELTETSRQISSLFREVEAAPQLLLLGRGRQAPGPGESGYEVPREVERMQETPAR